MRLNDLRRFYELLDRLELLIGGARRLGAIGDARALPKRGVYFFFEDGESCTDSGSGSRVVRVGTHALSASSRTTLKDRLSQHRGTVRTPGGNHRGSVFRKLIGEALIARGDVVSCATWGVGNTASRETRLAELALEAAVSATLGTFKVVWLNVNDEPGPQSLRGPIERNAIALLSNYGKSILDPPSAGWPGHASLNRRVVKSGLWNNNHVDETYDPTFLSVLSALIENHSCSATLDAGAPKRSPAAPRFDVHLDRGTNEHRILEQLRGGTALDDDEISGRAGIQPRQAVNQICRPLERSGILRRFVGPKNKIVNELTGTEPVAYGAEIGNEHPENVLRATSTKRLQRAQIVYEPAKTLILIPCSGTKRRGGIGELEGPSILDGISPPLARRLADARKVQLERSAYDATQLLPAAERYQGALYKAAGTLPVGAGKTAHAHLLIISGGYGVVRPDEPIGDYDARFRCNDWPKGLLEETLTDYARRQALSRIVAFASGTTDYRKLIRRTNWRHSWIESALLISPERCTGAMVKSPRAQGEALHAFLNGTLTEGFHSSDGLGIEVQSLL